MNKTLKKILIGFLAVMLVVVSVDVLNGAQLINYYGKTLVRLYGSVTLKNTSKTANLIVLQNVDGTARGSVDSAGNMSIAGSLTVGGSTTTGTITMGIDSFSTTATRKAVYISGALTTDKYIISKRLNYVQGSPVAAIIDSATYSYYAKADTLVVLRYVPSAGTGTSAANFSYLRYK